MLDGTPSLSLYLHDINEKFSDFEKSKIEFLEDGINKEVGDINGKQVDLVAINKRVQDNSYEDQMNQKHRQYIEVICECDNDQFTLPIRKKKRVLLYSGKYLFSWRTRCVIKYDNAYSNQLKISYDSNFKHWCWVLFTF